MSSEKSKSATKSDVEDLGKELRGYIGQVRDDISTEMKSIELRTDTKLETIRDEIIRAFQMAESDIRKETVHRDEFVGLDQRVQQIEKQL